MKWLFVLFIFTIGCNELDRLMDVDSEKPCREKCTKLNMSWRMVRFENSIQCRCYSTAPTITEENNKSNFTKEDF